MAVALALLASLAAASGGGPAAWLDVPFVRQAENGCGAACIAMVLCYWNGSADPGQVQQGLFEAGAKGVRAEAMENCFRARGYRTYSFRGTWTDLGRHIAKGRPLIVSLGGMGVPLSHYVVVAGIDPERQLVLVNDPAGRKLTKLHRSAFERSWQESDRWTLLALPGAR